MGSIYCKDRTTDLYNEASKTAVDHLVLGTMMKSWALVMVWKTT